MFLVLFPVDAIGPLSQFVTRLMTVENQEKKFFLLWFCQGPPRLVGVTATRLLIGSVFSASSRYAT